MIIFFSLAVLLVLVSLAILLPGLFRNRKIVTVDRDDKNIAMARERLAEIENDLAIGAMDEASYMRLVEIR